MVDTSYWIPSMSNKNGETYYKDFQTNNNFSFNVGVSKTTIRKRAYCISIKCEQMHCKTGRWLLKKLKIDFSEKQLRIFQVIAFFNIIVDFPSYFFNVNKHYR